MRRRKKIKLIVKDGTENRMKKLKKFREATFNRKTHGTIPGRRGS